VIVVPTDTVYGLAALPDREDSVRRIYLAKDRPAGQHLPVLAASIDQVLQLGVEIGSAAQALAAQWWPGPLTLVFGFSPQRNRPAWLVDREEVAVRIPHNDFLLALMEQTGVLVVTSANQHGSATPPTGQEALSTLAPHASLLIDGGLLEGAPSTLVNVRSPMASVEREGAISSDAIASVLAAAAGSS
jgi:L-threonylcarbamoyladenylate synthase